MEGQVHVPVVLETAGEPNFSFYASTTPLASRPIRVSTPGCAYVSYDWQGIATGAMGRRSNLLFTIPH